MAIFDLFSKRRLKSIITDNPTGYESEKVGNITIPDKLTDVNAFKLANSVAEIFFPIDFYADRISKLRFYIADKQGKEVINTELNRFITSPNPFFTLNDLIYQYVFSLMADGNAISYLNVPDIYKTINIGSIARLDILQPDLIYLNEFYNISTLNISNRNELIRQARYYDLNGSNQILDVNKLRIDCLDTLKKDNSIILARSPLFRASLSINTLLAVYSARYNVYVNNGAAGYLVKKTSTGDPLTAAINDPVTRDTILADINNRNGLTGNRNLWGVSSTPMEFINTLAVIKDLLPLEETFENAIKIASIWQIPSGLVPRKDKSTFDNQEVDERSVWENGIISMVQLVCDKFTKILTLDKSGYSIGVDYSNVSCLNINMSAKEEMTTKKIANLTAIKTSYPETAGEINKEFDKIILDYGNE